MGRTISESKPEELLSSCEERLYTAPLGFFAETRKKLVAELRAEGGVEQAKQLAARKKPSRVAWALNQVARKEPRQLEAFLEATEEVRAAEAKAVRERDMAAMTEAGRGFNVAIAKIVALCAKAVEQDGARMTLELERALGRALHAVLLASSGDVTALTRGLLTHDLEEPEDGPLFASTLESAVHARIGSPLAAAPGHGKRPAAAAADVAAERKRLEDEERRAAGAAAAAETARREREAEKRESEAALAEERARRAEHEAEEAMRYAREVQARAEAARREAAERHAAAKTACALVGRGGKSR